MHAADSHVFGSTDEALLEDTLGSLLQRIASRRPERPALIVRSQNVRMTYCELHDEVERVAAALLAIGLQRGDRVGIWSANRAEWVVLQFAVPLAGLILVNINPSYRAHELEYALNAVQCSALVLPRRFKAAHYLDRLAELAPELSNAESGRLRIARLPALREVILLDDVASSGTRNWQQLRAMGTADALKQLREMTPLPSCHDPVNIQFTSGTTGTPKGATLTHHSIINNAYFIGRAMQLTENDRLCIPVPFYHCFGMVLGNLAAVTHGACMVIPGEGFDPLATLETVAEERCTALHGVPTMFIAELEHAELQQAEPQQAEPRQAQFSRFDLSSLRTGIIAGSPCPVEVMRRVVDSMHLPDITIAYGMTETSPVSFQTVPDDPLERRVGSVGRVHPHLEVKLVDAQGNTVARGATGELCTRGYSVMLGYWHDEARTREVIDADGWMHSGDLAQIDAAGYCSIVGRLKDMIIRGGENVYPREIEEFLHAYPKVQDVQVFGVPDPKFGEQVCAWIRLREGCSASAAEIQDHCRHHLAYYKTPHYVRFVDTFPMTVTGKVQKYLMRKAMADELSAHQAAT